MVCVLHGEVHLAESPISRTLACFVQRPLMRTTSLLGDPASHQANMPALTFKG